MAAIYMTEEGYKKLMEELNRLEGIERPAISKQIAEARDKGDLSENASKLNTTNVQIMNKVKIRNIATKQEMTYTIVSESEANLKEHKLSVTTPIAKGLLGKKVGDKVEVTVPNGKIEFEIIEIAL